MILTSYHPLHYALYISELRKQTHVYRHTHRHAQRHSPLLNMGSLLGRYPSRWLVHFSTRSDTLASYFFRSYFFNTMSTFSRNVTRVSLKLTLSITWLNLSFNFLSTPKSSHEALFEALRVQPSWRGVRRETLALLATHSKHRSNRR